MYFLAGINSLGQTILTDKKGGGMETIILQTNTGDRLPSIIQVFYMTYVL